MTSTLTAVLQHNGEWISFIMYHQINAGDKYHTNYGHKYDTYYGDKYHTNY